MCSIDCSIQEIRLNKKVVVTWPDGKKHKGIIYLITKTHITIWYPDDKTYSDYGSRTDHPIKGLKFKRTRKRKKPEPKPKPKPEQKPEPEKKRVCLSDDKVTRLLLGLGTTRSEYQLETERVAELLLGLFP